MKLLLLAMILSWSSFVEAQAIPQAALKHRAQLTREAKQVFGILAPIPMMAAQIEQESSWRENVTAWDHGRGLAQFMDATATWIADTYPNLGRPDPYNPAWALRALVRLNAHNFARVQGSNQCEKWGAALKAYNAGLGWSQRAQRLSTNPQQWFGLTEYINAGQSAQNFEYSRMYPRWVLFKRQPKYLQWGKAECL
jgi:soluble lytic murein transglycosylase-like protein